MTKAKALLFLMVIPLLWMIYRCSPTTIDFEGYHFKLPLKIEEAVNKFQLDTISIRMGVRYDERGWLKIKTIQRLGLSEVMGVHFYFDDSLSPAQVMRQIENQYDKRFKSGKGIYSKREMENEWWYLEVNKDIAILVYPHTFYYPLFVVKGEKDHAGKGQGKQYVVAYVYQLNSIFSNYLFSEDLLLYMRHDGTAVAGD